MDNNENKKRLEEQMMNENYSKDLRGCLKVVVVGMIIALVVLVYLVYKILT